MRTIIGLGIAAVAALTICLVIIAESSQAAVGTRAAAGAVTETETAPLVAEQLTALRTTDGIRIKEALCKPANYFSVRHGLIFSDHWNCMVTDALNRAYALHTHVRNTDAGGLDSLGVTYCWRSTDFKCPSGVQVVLPDSGT
jgi:hypothetical protein